MSTTQGSLWVVGWDRNGSYQNSADVTATVTT